jgi:hypothetical protein
MDPHRHAPPALKGRVAMVRGVIAAARARRPAKWGQVRARKSHQHRRREPNCDSIGPEKGRGRTAAAHRFNTPPSAPTELPGRFRLEGADGLPKRCPRLLMLSCQAAPAAWPTFSRVSRRQPDPASDAGAAAVSACGLRLAGTMLTLLRLSSSVAAAPPPAAAISRTPRSPRDPRR